MNTDSQVGIVFILLYFPKFLTKHCTVSLFSIYVTEALSSTYECTQPELLLIILIMVRIIKLNRAGKKKRKEEIKKMKKKGKKMKKERKI